MSDQPYASLLFVEIAGPEAPKDRQRTRTIRSHAAGVALARQRRKAQEKGENFRSFTACEGLHPHRAIHTADATTIEAESPSGYLSRASIDPFETLPCNARRLTTLFHLKRSITAGEPVFNANDAIHYQTLPSVFKTGLTDGALTSALALTMCYAANGRVFDHECGELSSNALQQIRTKLSDHDAAASPAAIGSILLLLGIEYRLGARQGAQAHLGGIRTLLQLCMRKKVEIPVALRRAIYWQDLFSSIIVQTDRIVHYSDFHPGEASPTLCLSSFRCVSEGFACRASRLGCRFMSLVSDVAALYHCRSEWLKSNRDAQGLETLCNTQALLEGQLHELRQSTSDDLLISCVIAAFLCVYGFWTSVWNAALIPRGLSTQLLHHVRCWQRIEPQHDDDLLFWLVHIGKTFAIDPHIYHGLEELGENTQKAVADLPTGGKEAEKILHNFIWSDVFYQPKVGWFWQRIDEGK